MPKLPVGIRIQLEMMSRAILERKEYKDLDKPPHDHPDSDELTVFICQQLQAAGAKYRIRVVGASTEKGPDGEFHHCFAEVWHEPSKTWISLDPFQATKSWAADEIWEVK